jgi:hypothetical protein
LADRFFLGVLIINVSKPISTIKKVPWLISDPPDPAAWFDGASGERTLTIEAMEAIPIFRREFS